MIHFFSPWRKDLFFNSFLKPKTRLYPFVGFIVYKNCLKEIKETLISNKTIYDFFIKHSFH